MNKLEEVTETIAVNNTTGSSHPKRPQRDPTTSNGTRPPKGLTAAASEPQAESRAGRRHRWRGGLTAAYEGRHEHEGPGGGGCCEAPALGTRGGEGLPVPMGENGMKGDTIPGREPLDGKKGVESPGRKPSRDTRGGTHRPAPTPRNAEVYGWSDDDEGPEPLVPSSDEEIVAGNSRDLDESEESESEADLEDLMEDLRLKSIQKSEDKWEVIADQVLDEFEIVIDEVGQSEAKESQSEGIVGNNGRLTANPSIPKPVANRRGKRNPGTKACKRRSKASGKPTTEIRNKNISKPIKQTSHEGDTGENGLVTSKGLEWEVIEDEVPVDKEEMLAQFKVYARQRLGAWDSCGVRSEKEKVERRELRRKVDRFARATKEGKRLEACLKTARVGYPPCHIGSRTGALTRATSHQFLWTGQEGEMVEVPEYFGVPLDLRHIEDLRHAGSQEPESRRALMQRTYADMKNMDRLMSMSYDEESEDEYHKETENPRHFEEVNLFEGEEIDDLLTIESKVCKELYYAEPFEVILDSGAGEHVASDKDTPGYSIRESKGSRAGQNFIAAGGHKMPNRGEVALRLKTQGDKGREITTTFQVASVTRPLWSVARICDAGFKVTFDPSGAEITDKSGKVICRFQRVGNLYKAKLGLKNPMHKDFARQGQRR